MTEHRRAVIGWSIIIIFLIIDALRGKMMGYVPYQDILGERVEYDLLFLSWLFGFWILLLVGYQVSTRIFAPVFHAFAQALPYLRVMGPAVLGFGAIYLLIIGWFATMNYAIYVVAHGAAFSGVSAQGVHWQFLTFSLMNVTALGHSAVKPTSLWTADLAAVEWLLCLSWTLVVFAAVMARINDLLSARPQTALLEQQRVEIADLRQELSRVRVERDQLARRRFTLAISLPSRKRSRCP